MLRYVYIAAACAVALGISDVPAEAARVAPMSLELSPAGQNSIARIEVSNVEDRSLPMEVRMYRGAISEDGKLSLEPADDEFLVFPPQVVLEPESQQVFRIQYVGGPLAQSEVFYASVSQIPVQLDLTESRIQVLMRFNVLVNVVPRNSAAQPTVSWVRPTVRETGGSSSELPDGPRDEVVSTPGLEVRIENTGTKYFAAGRTAWTLSGIEESGSSYSQEFTQAQIAEMVGMGVVAPGRARVFFVPMDRSFREGTVNIELNR